MNRSIINYVETLEEGRILTTMGKTLNKSKSIKKAVKWFAKSKKNMLLTGAVMGALTGTGTIAAMKALGK